LIGNSRQRPSADRRISKLGCIGGQGHQHRLRVSPSLEPKPLGFGIFRWIRFAGSGRWSCGALWRFTLSVSVLLSV
jgi:hypothetical protein